MTMTNRKTSPIKLWLESPTEMRMISNKRPQLNELFKWLDYRDLGRISTLELFAVMIIAVDGVAETTINSKCIDINQNSCQSLKKFDILTVISDPSL